MHFGTKLEEKCLELNISAVTWYGGHRPTSLPNEIASVLANEIMAWHEGLDYLMKRYVERVDVTPSSGGHHVHVTLKTHGGGGETNVSAVPKGDDRFIYDCSIKTVANREGVSLPQGLTELLVRILERNLSLMELTMLELQRSLATVKKPEQR